MDWRCHAGFRTKHATVDQRCLHLSTANWQRCPVQYPLGCGGGRDRDDLLWLAVVCGGSAAVDHGGVRGCIVFRIPVRVCPSSPLPLSPLRADRTFEQRCVFWRCNGQSALTPDPFPALRERGESEASLPHCDAV